ncbi:alpha/beta fold hydrolase [Agrococcus baldri]|nr:alpha/beta fold hydrolase [Agrococcus baldri]
MTWTAVAERAQIEAESWGDRSDPAVLLIAGTSCSRDWWPPSLCEMLAAAGAFVIRFDQRDTGASTHCPVGAPDYGLGDLAADATAVLDAVDVERSHLVGMSQGGWVAQLVALERPERVASLTLIATRPTGHGPADADLPELSDDLLAAWQAQVEPDWDDREAVVDFLVEGERVLAGRRFDADAVRAVCETAMLRAIDIRAAGNHPMMRPTPRWRERLGAIAVPTTVLHGTLDPLFPIGNGEALAREIAGAELLAMDGVGHEVPRRVWPSVVDAVARGLRSGAADPGPR